MSGSSLPAQIDFVMPYYLEPFDLLRSRLHRLSMLYPDSKKIAIADGVDRPDVVAFATEKGWAHHQNAERLKGVEHGDRWLSELIKVWLDTKPSDTTRMVWIDPDSRVFNRLNPPDGDVVGPISSDHSHFMGGVICLSKSAAIAILDRLPDLPIGRYQRYKPPFLKPQETQSDEFLCAYSLTIWKACRSLDIQPIHWPLDCRPRHPHLLSSYIPPASPDIRHPDTSY